MDTKSEDQGRPVTQAIDATGGRPLTKYRCVQCFEVFDAGNGECPRCRPNIVTLADRADPPAKARILALIEELRQEAEAGEMVALVVIPIAAGRQFGTRSAGDIAPSSLAGYIARAHLDALDLMKD